MTSPKASTGWPTLIRKSLERLTDCRVEPILANAQRGERYQFERLGYFCVDSRFDEAKVRCLIGR